jgi:dihydrofolate reductase
MGRKTYASIGKTLPDRINIVMTRDDSASNRPELDLDADTQRIFTSSIEDTLFFADVISICRGKKDIFVIGGAHMFELFGDLVNKIYLTEVYTGKIEGDAIFDMKFDRRTWKTIFEDSIVKREGIDDYGFLFSILERRERRNRYAFVRQFMTDIDSKEEWLKNNVNKHKRELERYLTENLELGL